MLRSQPVVVGSQQAMQPAACDEGQQRRVQEAFGDLSATATEVIDAVVRLELAKKQFDLPACGVRTGEMHGGQPVARYVGDVQMVPLLDGVPGADHAHGREGVTPGASTMGEEMEVGIEVQRVAAEARKHLLQSAPDEALMLGVSGRHEPRIAMRLESREEKAAVLPDALEEQPVEVAHVEQQELVAHPRANAQKPQVLATSLRDAHAARPAADGIDHQ